MSIKAISPSITSNQGKLSFFDVLPNELLYQIIWEVISNNILNKPNNANREDLIKNRKLMNLSVSSISKKFHNTVVKCTLDILLSTPQNLDEYNTFRQIKTLEKIKKEAYFSETKESVNTALSKINKVEVDENKTDVPFTNDYFPSDLKLSELRIMAGQMESSDLTQYILGNNESEIENLKSILAKIEKLHIIFSKYYEEMLICMFYNNSNLKSIILENTEIYYRLLFNKLGFNNLESIELINVCINDALSNSRRVKNVPIKSLKTLKLRSVIFASNTINNAFFVNLFLNLEKIEYLYTDNTIFGYTLRTKKSFANCSELLDLLEGRPSLFHLGYGDLDEEITTDFTSEEEVERKSYPNIKQIDLTLSYPLETVKNLYKIFPNLEIINIARKNKGETLSLTKLSKIPIELHASVQLIDFFPEPISLKTFLSSKDNLESNINDPKSNSTHT